MPKKKKAPRRKTTRREKPLPELVHGPARTLLTSGLDDPEVLDLLAQWPFSMTSKEGVSGWTTLNKTGAEAGTSVEATAQSFVDLEDAGLLVWEPAQATYVMTSPENAMDAVQLNKDLHECMICHDVVTSVDTDGSNQPCGHRVPTLVTKTQPD